MTKDESGVDPFTDKSFDQFWLNNVFPDADTLFAVKQKSVEEIKGECHVALDANVLLLPYEMGAESFSKIAEVYKFLTASKRLFIPAQAAREFVKNRANKLRDLVKQISDQASSLNFSFHKEIGFLENDPAFSDIKEQSGLIGSARTKLLQSVKRLRSSLTDNIGADPVSVVYQDLFSKNVVSVDDNKDSREALIEDMKWRYKHKVPPGYKDGSKDDGGIGDFLIWKTILEYGKKNSVDCIFVTKDLKGDWWVQSQGTFQPRVELIEEYFRYTGGKTIHLISLSSLLESQNVAADTVTDVKRVEANVVQQAIRAEMRPIEFESYQVAGLFIGDEPLDSRSVSDLVRMKREIDRRVMQLHHDARPVRRKIESPDLVDSLDEATTLELYEQDKRLRTQRSQLRSHGLAIQRELERRSELSDD